MRRGAGRVQRVSVAARKENVGLFLLVFLLGGCASPEDPLSGMAEGPRSRPRALGIPLGLLPPGPLNAVTDVEGVRVGQVTIQEGGGINTGVTVILPHAGNLFREKVPAAVAVLNGFGKLSGVTQLQELGLLETPVGLTNTLAVGTVTEALARFTLDLPGNEEVRSVNAVVGETNDGFLNDIRRVTVEARHVRQALQAASGGPVAEGAVGAGTGCVAFGWKGGIGTSSRRLPPSLGGHTVGVLVQANFGGILRVAGVPVGARLAPLPFGLSEGDGSCMIVLATDAPLDAHALERLAKRTFLGLARTGSFASHGSGDYAIAFSTAPTMIGGQGIPLPGPALSPLFLAAVEATEEAVLNALFTSRGMQGHRGEVPGLPVERVLEILRHHRLLEDAGGGTNDP